AFTVCPFLLNLTRPYGRGTNDGSILLAIKAHRWPLFFELFQKRVQRDSRLVLIVVFLSSFQRTKV
ncbi:hypothetical protein LQF59_13655, partial [Tetragenococcus koreensis]|uniref:hypothetical protein n=1 Tax=Tetragenococcus koreensis TaxID=290335 RepID=UPI001F222A85